MLAENSIELASNWSEYFWLEMAPWLIDGGPVKLMLELTLELARWKPGGKDSSSILRSRFEVFAVVIWISLRTLCL